MCGIVAVFNVSACTEELRQQVLAMSGKLRHRGPDWSGIYCSDKAVLAHERLAIVDPFSGGQPLKSADGKLILSVNGEIYNHQQFRKELQDKYAFQTGSDSEVILALYQEKGIDFLEDLNGIFAFALYDAEQDVYLIGRDHMGIIPLYHGWDKEGRYYVASELKALEGICYKIETFPPGHYFYSRDKQPTRYYKRDWRDYARVQNNETDLTRLRQGLEEAVHRQLMSDVPFGVLISGGLDSSIIAAITKKFSARRVESHDLQEAWWPQLHSFAVGLKDAPDLKFAREVAEHIGTVHHEINFTVQEGLDAVRDVIYHLETYDVTTVRASTPMYLMARVIRSMGIKMVLSGEGADELFGGYLYFHKAPNAEEFHKETVRKLDKLHLYDCLRANKSLAAWGVEGRVPFLDKDFMDIAMTINPRDKMTGPQRMEKWVLRQAFADYLPETVVWRQKEQFSDGVGYSWIDALKEKVEQEVTDEQMARREFRFPVNPPLSKEEYYYRTIFEQHFPSETAAATVPSVPSVACSTPEVLAWDEELGKMVDPSGRAVANVHTAGYGKKNSQ